MAFVIVFFVTIASNRLIGKYKIVKQFLISIYYVILLLYRFSNTLSQPELGTISVNAEPVYCVVNFYQYYTNYCNQLINNQLILCFGMLSYVSPHSPPTFASNYIDNIVLQNLIIHFYVCFFF